MAQDKRTYTLNAKRSFNFRIPADFVMGGAFHILFQGKLRAGGRDCRLKLRLNKEDIRYRSIASMNGGAITRDNEAGSQSRESLYLGRNGWGEDADIFLDYHVIWQAGYKKCGHGKSTFALSNQDVLGFAAHGYQSTVSRLDSATLMVEQGGTLTGRLRIIYELN